MAESVYLWSTTAASNSVADSAINWAENQLPGSVNGSARSMMAAISKFLGDINGTLTTGGSSNAYTIASPNTSHTSLSSGILIGFKANHTNTGASTFNLSSIGAKDIKAFNSSGGESDLLPGQITENGHYQIEYDSALDGGNGAWVLRNPSPDTLPGELRAYCGASAPTGWLLCYGQAISRTTYAALFAVIGTTFGTGDGSTTFNLPDLRGRTLFGKDNMGGSTAGRITSGLSAITGTTLGAVGGLEAYSLLTAELPVHTHTGTSASGGSHSHTTSSEGTHTHTYSGTSSGQSGTHTHDYSGTTSGHSVGHTHDVNFTSGGQSASHTHGLTSSFTFLNATAGSSTTFTYLSNTAGSQSLGTSSTTSADHTHSVFGTTSGVSADHTHTYSGTSAAASADHTHTYSGTTSSQSDHTHTISTDSGHTHTFTSDSTGSGDAHQNMPPAMIVNYIIRH